MEYILKILKLTLLTLSSSITTICASIKEEEQDILEQSSFRNILSDYQLVLCYVNIN